jgi:hypothetical protein
LLIHSCQKKAIFLTLANSPLIEENLENKKGKPSLLLSRRSLAKASPQTLKTFAPFIKKKTAHSKPQKH